MTKEPALNFIDLWWRKPVNTRKINDESQSSCSRWLATVRCRHRFRYFVLIRLVAIAFPGMSSFANGAVTLEVPRVVLEGLSFEVAVNGDVPSGLSLEAGSIRYKPLETTSGVQFSPLTMPSGNMVLVLRGSDGEAIDRVEKWVLPGWLSLLPPISAFALALVLRQVIPALFVGIWLGAFLIAGPSIKSIWQGMLDVVSEYTVKAIIDPGHAMLIVFTFTMGGLVAILYRNGGTHGIVEKFSRWTNTARRGQVATFLLGLAFFFDDYANTLVVGKTMRPISDAVRVSREKLAFLVDSTAAPVATLALISSWIGFQLGLIEDAVGRIDGFDEHAYVVFLNALPYNFYPILMLLFVLVVALSGRDFGPMWKAEHRARSGENPDDPGRVTASEDFNVKIGAPHRALNALLPLGTLLFTMLAGLYVTGVAAAGAGAGLRDIIGSADSYLALLWATVTAVMIAACLSIGQRILSVSETVDAWYSGSRSMLLAVIILVLAWALSNVNSELHTAEYLAALLGDTLDARLLPAAVFILAALTAFATGTSWGVMGILMPLVIPLAWTSMQYQGLEGAEHLLYASVSAVLAGAVMGDHASPISDTTVLSSAAASCDHIEHVRTQVPYALTVGAISITVGSVPSAFGVPWWVCLIVGAVCVIAAVRWLGRPV